MHTDQEDEEEEQEQQESYEVKGLYKTPAQKDFYPSYINFY